MEDLDPLSVSSEDVAPNIEALKDSAEAANMNLEAGARGMSLEPASEAAAVGSTAPQTSVNYEENAKKEHFEAPSTGEATINDAGAAVTTDPLGEAVATEPSQAAAEAEEAGEQQEGQQEEKHLRGVRFAPPMQEQEAKGQLVATDAPEPPVAPAAMPIHETELVLPLTDTAESNIAVTVEQPVPASVRQQVEAMVAPAAAMTLPEQREHTEASLVADCAAAAPTVTKHATVAAALEHEAAAQLVDNGDSALLPEALTAEGPAAPAPAPIAAAPAPLPPEPAAPQPYPTPEAAAAIALAAEQVAAALLGDLSSSMDGEDGVWQASQAAHGQPPAEAAHKMPLRPQLAPWAQHPALYPYSTAATAAWAGGASSPHPPSADSSHAANDASAMVPAAAGGYDPALHAALTPARPLTAFPVAHLTDAVDSGLQTMRHRIRTAVERENELRLETELAAVEREALAQARALAEANAEVERGARRTAEAEAQRALAELHEARRRGEAEATQLHAVAAGLERLVAGLRAELASEVARRQAAERQLERQARRVVRPLQALMALATDPHMQAWGGALPAPGSGAPSYLGPLQQPAEPVMAGSQAAAADQVQPPAAAWSPRSHAALHSTQSPQRLMQDVREWLSGGWAPACDTAEPPPLAHQPRVPMPPAHQPTPPALERQSSPVKQRSPSPARRPMSAAARPRTGWDYRPAWRDCGGSGSGGRRPEAEPADPPSPSRAARQPGAGSQAQQALGELSAGLEQLRRSCSPRPPQAPAAVPATQPPPQQQVPPLQQQWLPAFAAPSAWGYAALPPPAQLGAAPGLLSPAYHDAALAFSPLLGAMPISGAMATFGACPSIPAYWGGAAMPAAAPGASGILPSGDPLARPSTAAVLPFQQAQEQQAWPTHTMAAAPPQSWGAAAQQQHWPQPAAAPPARQRPSTPGIGLAAPLAGSGHPGMGCAREPFLVPGLESASRPRSAAARSKARQLAVPPHRVDEAALAAARADYLEERRAIKAKRMRELAATE